MADDLESSKKLNFVVSVEKLSLLQKQAGVFKRCLGRTGEALSTLRDVPHLEGSLEEINDRASTFENSAEELSSNAYNTVNLMMALDSFKGGQNLKIFTYLNFVTQPIAVMTGWYGMNFVNMPDYHYIDSYWVFIGVAGFVVLSVITFLLIKT